MPYFVYIIGFKQLKKYGNNYEEIAIYFIIFVNVNLVIICWISVYNICIIVELYFKLTSPIYWKFFHKLFVIIVSKEITVGFNN